MNIKYSNAYEQIRDKIKDKKNHFFHNNDCKNNSTEVRFGSSLTIDPSHRSYFKEHETDTAIASYHEKLSHPDLVVKSNSTKKEVVQEISFSYTDDFFTIKFQKQSTQERLETEIKAVVDLCGKNFVDEAPGTESEVTVVLEGSDVATAWLLCKTFS